MKLKLIDLVLYFRNEDPMVITCLYKIHDKPNTKLKLVWSKERFGLAHGILEGVDIREDELIYQLEFRQGAKIKNDSTLEIVYPNKRRRSLESDAQH